MKKLINSADTLLEESLDGLAAAHADILLLGAERKFVRRRTLKPGKVALISGGGSGIWRKKPMRFSRPRSRSALASGIR